MKRLILVTVMFAVGCVDQGAVESDESYDLRAPSLVPRLQPLAFTVGIYSCAGDYQDAPPFIVAHHNVGFAVFSSSTNGEWIKAIFQEFLTPDNPVPASTVDLLTIDRINPGVPGAWNGRRTLVDDKTGQLQGKFTLNNSTLEFSGIYLIATPFGDLPVPFHETVQHSPDGFLSTASIDNPFAGGARQVFLVERCVRIFGGAQ